MIRPPDPVVVSIVPAKRLVCGDVVRTRRGGLSVERIASDVRRVGPDVRVRYAGSHGSGEWVYLDANDEVAVVVRSKAKR